MKEEKKKKKEMKERKIRHLLVLFPCVVERVTHVELMRYKTMD
jgi:hypothetical protein